MSEKNRETNLGVSAIKRAQGRNARLRQKVAIVCIGVAVMLLAAALALTLYVTSIYTYDDVDGTVYLVKKVDGVYVLCENDGDVCSTVVEGGKTYYVTSLGTMVSVDAESGETSTFAVVHTEGTEVQDFDVYVLMYKQLTYDKGKEVLVYDEALGKKTSNVIASIEVTNQNGSFAFVRDENGNFIIKGKENAPISAEIFAELAGACGYTLASRRLQNPLKLSDGSIDFAEYGLAPEVRIDENGNEYEYIPTVYTVTTMTGESHTVTVGDKTVTDSGYYAKYEGRDTIYVLGAESAFGRDKLAILNSKVEAFAVASIVYPMDVNNYFNVSDFVIYDNIDYEKIYTELESLGFTGENADGEEFLKQYGILFDKYSHKVCDFYFADLEQRQGTMYAYTPYISNLAYAEGYYLNSNNVDVMLSGFYQTEFGEVVKLSPSGDDLKEYGLLNAEYVVGYLFKTSDKDGKTVYVENFVEISKKTPDGYYYAYSTMYDMIVSVKEASFAFLEWDDTHWYDENYIQLSISDIESILIESPNFKVNFGIEDSASKYLELIWTGWRDDFEIEENGIKKKYEIVRDKNGKYVLKSNGEKVSPLYAGDYMLTPTTYTVGTRNEEGYDFYEASEIDLNGDGTNDGVLYRIYYVIRNEKGDGYTLAAATRLTDYNGNPIKGGESDDLAQVAYESDYFKTNNGYLFFVAQDSAMGSKLDERYGDKRGEWGHGKVFVSADGQLILVNQKNGAWMYIDSVTNGLYLADATTSRLAKRAITIPEKRGSDGKLQRYAETFYPLTDKSMMYDKDNDMIVTYDRLNGVWKKVTYSECTIGVWGKCEYYVLEGGFTVCVDTESGQWGKVGVLSNPIYIADIYANGERLDYEIAKEGYSASSQRATAFQNFQELYKYMLSASFEDLAELDESEKEAFRQLDDFTSGDESACVLKITIKASDYKGNERDVVYRFYRYSERRAYLTIEMLDEDGISSSEEAYGNFSVLYSFVQKVIADAQKELDEKPIYSNEKY